VEEHHADWIKLLRDFYGPVPQRKWKTRWTRSSTRRNAVALCLFQVRQADALSHQQETASSGMPATGNARPRRRSIQQGKPTLREVSEFKCPNCGREMNQRKGRFGEFLGCSGLLREERSGRTPVLDDHHLDKDGKPLPPKTPPDCPTIKCEKGRRGDGCSATVNAGRGSAAELPQKCRGMKNLTSWTPIRRNRSKRLSPCSRKAPPIGRDDRQDHRRNPVTASAAQAQNITTDIDCDECGKPMIIRNGRRGKFLGCSGYPKCKKPSEVPAKLLEELGLKRQ